MANRKIEVQLVGDSRSLERAFGRSQTAGQQWGRRLGVAAKAGGLALAAGIGAGLLALKSTVGAAKEAELAQLRLKAQLKAAGLSWEAHRDQIDKVLTAQSRLSAFDDEELSDSLTNLVRVTGDVNKALNLNALAADFARAKGMPVAKAGELIGKVYGGNLGILSRYGIVLKEGATAQEALAELQRRFAGQAEAYGKSTAGAQERFGEAVENLQEKIGAKLLPVLADMFDAGVRFMDWAEKNWPRFQQFVGQAIDKVRPHFERLVAYWQGTLLPAIQQVVELARRFWNRFGETIMRNMRAMIQIIRSALNVVKGIFELFIAILRGDWSAAWKALKDIARNALQGLLTFLRNIVSNVLAAGKAIGGAIKDGIVAGVRGLASLLASLVRGAINAVISAIRGFGIPGFKIDPPGPGSFSFPGVHPFAGIPSIATGGDISRTGLAMVHRGETVRSARVTNRGGGGGGPWQLALVAIGPDLARELQQLNARHMRGNGGRSIW